MNKTRAERLDEFERWSERVAPEELRDADPDVTREILDSVEERADVQGAIATAHRAK